jgi:NADH dehydrogenase [ubiquinone] 1 alpha subcomplex assembly factor 7
MFGELVGAALADVWVRAGRPPNAIYAELGPGRGTLAVDALRVLKRAGFAGSVHFVETSPVLRGLQAESLPDAHWHNSIADLPAVPLLLVANEFFDALPVRQFVGGIERRVMIAAGGLAFDRDGEIVETSPVQEAAVSALATCIAECGGVAMVIDYGHEKSAPGDTLQAVRGHRYVPTLVDPGEQDLTAHVDFEALGGAARNTGAEVTRVVTQGKWLNSLGIGARAAAIATANPERVRELETAIDRLCHEEQMGQLFKVMAIHATEWPVPAGFAQ